MPKIESKSGSSNMLGHQRSQTMQMKQRYSSDNNRYTSSEDEELPKGHSVSFRAGQNLMNMPHESHYEPNEIIEIEEDQF